MPTTMMHGMMLLCMTTSIMAVLMPLHDHGGHATTGRAGVGGDEKDTTRA